MAKRPVEFLGLMSAGAASIAGILGVGLIVIEIIYRVVSADWDDFTIGELLKTLIPAAILLALGLFFVSIQAFLDVAEDERDNPFN